VRVTFKKIRGRLRLSVADNGIGFEIAALQTAAAGTCLGIHGMRERVAILDGAFSVQSTPGTGTTIMAEVPLKGKQSSTRAG